jgi:hypothetical protein
MQQERCEPGREEKPKPWPRSSRQSASGKPGAVHCIQFFFWSFMVL